MKVQLKTLMSGPGGTFSPGVHDFPKPLAYGLIEGGFAEQVAEPEKERAPAPPPPAPPASVVETTAAAGAPETATAPAQKKGKRKAS